MATSYQVTIRVNSARGLRSADLNGKSDPVAFLSVDGRLLSVQVDSNVF